LRKERGERFYRKQVGEKSVWSCSTVSHILRDQRYVGDAVYGKVKPASVGSRKDVAVPKEEWIVVPDNHEPLKYQKWHQSMAVTVNQSGRKRLKMRYCVRCGSWQRCMGKGRLGMKRIWSGIGRRGYERQNRG